MSKKHKIVSRQPQIQPGPRQENLLRFTTKSWAVSALALKQRRDPVIVLDLVGFFHWLGDKNAEMIVRSLPPLPCKVGCCYCCYVEADLPDLLPLELFRIITFLTNEGFAVLPHIRERLAQTDAAPSDPSGKPGGASRPPCLFLADDRCLVYPVRPMRCRAQYSPDVEACRQSYLGQRETMPLLSDPALLYQSLRVGIRLGLEEVGLESRPLALRRALQVVLREPDTFPRWLGGETVLRQARLSQALSENRFMAQFRRQARQQVGDQGAALQSVIATFLDAPGAWARYSITGMEPRI